MKLRRRIPLIYYSLIVSLFTFIVYNIPFLKYAIEIATMPMLTRVFVLTSLVVIVCALNMMLTYLFVYLTRYVGRVLIGITLIINALAEYFMLTYSVILDDSMISNIFNTRYSEASGYFSWAMLFFVLILGVLPAIWVVWQPVVYGTKKKFGKVCGGLLGLALVLILANISQTLWISGHDTQLGGRSLPWSYIANSVRYLNMHDMEEEKEIALPDGEIADTTKTVVVLVIGESDRKANFQLYGYKRQDNPLLAKQKGVEVFDAQSCATYTTAGVRSILEPKDDGPLYEVLPNYAYRMGADVVWRTANWGEPPIHAKEYLGLKELAEKYPEVSKDDDGILFYKLKERILQSDKNKVLIILHTTTSHGPNYCLRVPKAFQKFQPILDNVEDAEKNPQALVNAYDNSILYTDYMLSNLVDTLRTMKDWHSAMLFVSDHGESLGEKKIYMHGIPKNVAPKCQYEIPFIVWTSDGFKALKPKKQIDQHYVFHSVINLLGIKTSAYNPEHDIFKQAIETTPPSVKK